MPEKISILKESGETLTSNVVSVFLIPDTGKRYIITTENAVDPHGLTVLHVSEIVDGTLQKIATDDEWSAIKTIMRAIISGNVGSYQYLPTIENIKASGQYSRDISVSASASKQMIDNYMAADKSAVTAANATGGAIPQNGVPVQGETVSPVPPAVPQQPIQPSTIFPEANPSVNSDEELIPGIAELPSNGNTGSVPSVPPMAPSAPVVSPQVQEPEVATPVGVTPVIGPISQEPVGAPVMNSNVGDVSNPVSPVPVVEAPVPSVMEPVAPVENSVVSSPVEMNNPISSMTASNIQVPVLSAQPVQSDPVVPNNMLQTPVVEPVSPSGVQVVEPTQIVPSAQIVQEVQVPAAPNLPVDSTSSFAPNATLDEVVLGAQEMFMEGVKNLVQTIQEKVYRDLYAKEAELKAKEEMLAQKEAMLNNQMVGMGTPVASTPVTAMSNVPTQPTMPAQPPVINTAPVVNGPMIVSADNDK